MAYIAPDEDEDKKNEDQQGPEQVLSGQSSEINTGPSTQASQGNQGAAPATPKGTTGSKGWTNLQRYVDANQGQDARMGQAIQSTVADNGQRAQQSGTGYRQNAQTAIQQGSVKDSGLIDQLGKAPRGISKEQFQQQYNGSYQGPTSYNEGDLGAQASGTQQQYAATTAKADQVQDFNGRAAVLDEIYRRPSYTAGEKRLDSFLVGGGEGGAAALGDIKSNYGAGSSFAGGWDNLVGLVNSDIASGQQASQKTVDDTHAAYNAARQNVEGSIKSAADKAAEAAQKSSADYSYNVSLINSRSPEGRSEGWKRMGVDPSTAEWLMGQGMSLQDIVRRGQDKSLGDFVSGSDVDTYNSLLGLTDDKATYDFKKSGSSGKLAESDSVLFGKGAEARALQNDLNKRLSERGSEADRIAAAFTSFDPKDLGYAAQKLGVPLATIQEAQKLGINPLTFFKRGGAVGLSDVANSKEQKQWADLLGYLGGKGVNLNLGPSGAKYSFNNDGLSAAIMDAKKAKMAELGNGQSKTYSTSLSGQDKSAFKKASLPGGTYGKFDVYAPDPDEEGLAKAAQKVMSSKGNW